MGCIEDKEDQVYKLGGNKIPFITRYMNGKTQKDPNKASDPTCLL